MQIRKGKYVKKKVLQKHHERYSNEVFSQLQQKLDDTDFSTAIIKRLENEINQLYEKIKKDNAETKPIWINRLTDVAKVVFSGVLIAGKLALLIVSFAGTG